MKQDMKQVIRLWPRVKQQLADTFLPTISCQITLHVLIMSHFYLDQCFFSAHSTILLHLFLTVSNYHLTQSDIQKIHTWLTSKWIVVGQITKFVMVLIKTYSFCHLLKGKSPLLPLLSLLNKDKRWLNIFHIKKKKLLLKNGCSWSPTLQPPKE